MDKLYYQYAVCDLFHGPEPPALPALVFVRTRAEAAGTAHDLGQQKGLRTCAVHGQKSQEHREWALTAMRNGELDVVVSTSCWNTGIDITPLRSVVNATDGLSFIDQTQVAGRGTRAEDGKDGFELIDIQSPGPRGLTKAQMRADAYVEAGFAVRVAPLGVQPRYDQLDDRAARSRAAQILEAEGPYRSAARIADPERTDLQDEPWALRPWGESMPPWLSVSIIVLFVVAMIYDQCPK